MRRGSPTAGSSWPAEGAVTMPDGPLLALEASSGQGSVAVLRGGRVLAEEAVALRSADEERLLPAVARALAAAGVAPPGLAGIACGAGPGSFTGLRIAAATAKGLAQALGVPIWGVPSLALAAAGAEPPLPTGRYLVLLDALRGERFAQPVTVGDGGIVTVDGPARLVAAAEAEAQAAAEGRVRIGPGEEPARAPHARGVARLGAAPFLAGPVPLDRWEPDYGRLAEAQAKWEAAHGRALPPG